MKKLFLLSILSITLLTACKKPELAGDEPTGEGLVAFTLKAPASGTALTLNAATPNDSVVISWNASKPGVHAAPYYKWVASPKANGDLTNPLIQIPANNNGLATQLTLTFKQVDDALKAAGIVAGATTELIWNIQADNGDTRLLSQNQFFITITRFKDGATPFLILSPVSSATALPINPGSATDMLTFSWQRSYPAAGGAAIRYKVVFVQHQTDGSGAEVVPDFSKPLFSIAADNSGVDTLANVSWKAISDSLNAHGLTDISQASDLQWTVVATSGTWAQQSGYYNQLVLLRIVRMYITGNFQAAGGFGANWDPATAPEMVRDSRAAFANKMYYTYQYFPASTELKFVQGRSNSVNYGGSGGNLVQGSATTIKIATAGVYRVGINVATLTYDVSVGRMGFVGGAVTGVGWDPSMVFPAGQMAFITNNKFLGIHDFAADGWKMLDAGQWNQGSDDALPSNPHSYSSAGPSGSALVVNSPDINMPNFTTAGRYRVVWDGTDVDNAKYTLTSAANMYVIGSATVGGWDNQATQDDTQRPPLTYQGNGVWKGTVSLVPGEIKFIILKGNWDFSYGGSGGKLNDGNIPIAAAGTYTITVDEYNQTYSVQ